MPPTPVDDHTEEFEQLAGLSALDVLDGEELARFDAHAAHCERCRVIVRLDREALALAAPEMDPSPDFKARLMQRAAAELATAEPEALTAEPEAPVEAPPPNVVPFRRRAPVWASAIAALFVIGILGLGGYAYQNQVIATYPLTGDVGGSAVVNVRRSGATDLAMRGVASPPPGYLYEAWIIPKGGAPVPAGVISSGDGAVPLNGVSPGDTVAITQERSRVDSPTPPVLLSVTVQS